MAAPAVTPPTVLHADQSGLLALARRKWVITALAGVPAAATTAAILVIEYRFMLFAVVALCVPLVAAIDAWRAGKSARVDRFATLEVHPQGVIVRTAAGEVRAAHGAGASFRASPDLLTVALSDGTRWRRWQVPGPPAAVAAAVAVLRSCGVAVAEERGIGSVAALLAGVVVGKILAVVAAGLVLGALANIGLALGGVGGSLALGLALLAGAFVCLIPSALLRLFVDAQTRQ